MTIFIPKWILWTLGVIIGVPVAIILIVILYLGVIVFMALIDEIRQR